MKKKVAIVTILVLAGTLALCQIALASPGSATVSPSAPKVGQTVTVTATSGLVVFPGEYAYAAFWWFYGETLKRYSGEVGFMVGLPVVDSYTVDQAGPWHVDVGWFSPRGEDNAHVEFTVYPADGVPEFPVGFAFIIAFIPALTYLWLKRKHRIL